MIKLKQIDLGLLLFRVMVSAVLYINHGHEKLFDFSGMLNRIADPLHIGKLPGLLFATFSDVVCAALVFIGFRVRLAAAFIALNTFLAFVLVQKLDVTSFRGEIALLYFCCSLLLCFTGGGAYGLERASHKQQ